MNKEILYEILNSESESLTSAEIENIMNEELDKSPDEMDTDLIELCLDALTNADEEKLNSKKHRIRLSRMLLVAIIFILILGLTIPACAKIFNMDVPEGVVKVYKDCFYIDISNDKYVSDINGQLENDGIINSVLPEFIYLKEAKIYDYKFDKGNSFDAMDFSFSYNELSGTINIVKYHNNTNVFNSNTISNDFENIKYFEGNHCNGVILCNEFGTTIQYSDENISYSISTDCDYETALEIAEAL